MSGIERVELMELGQRLSEAGIDVDPLTLWQQFSREVSGQYELSGFVKWLGIKGIVDQALVEELLAEIAVEVTGLDVLGSFYDRTRTVDLKHGDILMPVAAPLRKTHYLMLKQVGAGAMGEVHLAKDRLLRRTVAFKKLLQKAMDPAIVMRFLGEAQITSQLDHPHVVPIYGLESNPEGGIAYTMKMVHGDSLKQWLAGVKVAYHLEAVSDEQRLASRIRLFLKICDALSFAHSKGVIHRDLKPANIMLGRYGEVYVMDWGIARPFGPAMKAVSNGEAIEVDSLELYAHEAGQIVGTPRYMSPEQAAGMNDELDQRSDLFAMGLILYEMVSLRQAIQAKNMQQTLHKVIKRELEPLAHLYGEAIPPALAAIINRATARRRAERYANIAELADDLRRLLADEKVTAHDETLLQSLQRGIQRHRQLVLPVLMGLLLLGGGTVLGLQLLKQHQLEQAELQRRQTSLVMMALAEHAQQISGRFQVLEAQLQQLSAAVRVAVGPGRPAAGPVYTESDFAAGRVPDLADSPILKGKVSLDWPVLRLSASAGSLGGKLEPLRYVGWRLLAQDRDGEFLKLPPAAQHRQVLAENREILSLHVGLADGSALSYPGRIGVSADPLQASWYRQAAGSPGTVWAMTYDSPAGKVIPGSQAVRDEQGELLGVAALELSQSEVAAAWLPLSFYFKAEAVWLLTADGRLVAATPAAPVLDPAALAELQRTASGFARLPQNRFRAHTLLTSMGWHLVIEGNLTSLSGRLMLESPAKAKS